MTLCQKISTQKNLGECPAKEHALWTQEVKSKGGVNIKSQIKVVVL